MSTFGGQIDEISNISIDRFDGDNVNSSVYFLSHVHADHTYGLFQLQSSLLERSDVYLYASSVSIKILQRKFPDISSKLKEITIGSPTIIKFPNEKRSEKSCFFNVTALPAGHCPGSVMFLFETVDEKNILYTGDYRVSVCDLKKYNDFYNSLGILKRIDAIYLDTTFFKEIYAKFPPRKETSDEICKLVSDWVIKSKKHVIHLQLSATYGSEYLFMEIFKAVGMPIHVDPRVYDLYKYVPEMDDCVTTESSNTQIHAACSYSYKIDLKRICLSEKDYLVRKIIPSAVYWKTSNLNNGMVEKDDSSETFRVCYSCHCSFEEIKEFLLFLKPKKIIPNVEPTKYDERIAMHDLIAEILTRFQNDIKEEITFFDEKPSNFLEDNVETNSDLDDLLDSPPPYQKRKRSPSSDH